MVIGFASEVRSVKTAAEVGVVAWATSQVVSACSTDHLAVLGVRWDRVVDLFVQSMVRSVPFKILRGISWETGSAYQARDAR